MQLVVNRQQLDARLTEFALDPQVMALGDLTPESYSELATSDSEDGNKVREVQLRAEELAYESFIAADEDSLEASFHLLNFSPPNAFGRLADAIENEAQLWAFSEYILRRYPEMFENPEYVFNDLIGRGPYEEIFATVYALIGGATQPTAEPIESPEFSAAFKSKHHVVFQETVIVHGTGAKSKTWWREQPGQRNFWAYIHKYCTGLFGAGKEFSWSGGNTNSDREQGARDFINWWQTVGAPRPLQVIAHSHGCNVVYLACVMEPKLHISNMVSLGGPVRTWYPPPIDMQARISRIHNIYSRFDTVQLLGSIGGRRGEGRTLADSAQITNYHVAWEDPGVQVKSVGHSDLHEPVVWHNNKIAEKTLL